MEVSRNVTCPHSLSPRGPLRRDISNTTSLDVVIHRERLEDVLRFSGAHVSWILHLHKAVSACTIMLGRKTAVANPPLKEDLMRALQTPDVMPLKLSLSLSLSPPPRSSVSQNSGESSTSQQINKSCSHTCEYRGRHNNS